MKPTELVYSSHDRSEHLHRDWIVERALQSWSNKTIFYLPFSSPSRGDQEYSWGTFSPYFDRFRHWGLEPRSFFFTDSLRKEDVDLFFYWLAHSEVVVLGGGRTLTGLERYARVGEVACGDPEQFVRVLGERRARGLLTVGFSAGADQLCEWSCDEDSTVRCYGLVSKVVSRLHYEPAAEANLLFLARAHTDCLAFGLPNDSGIASNEGLTPQGRPWQLLRFILDTAWDKPEDQWHIKTRQGVKIAHKYADGRDWQLNNGDFLLRIFQADGTWEAWIGGPSYPRLVSYASQEPTDYSDPEAPVSQR